MTLEWLNQELLLPRNAAVTDLSSVIDSVKHWVREGKTIERWTIRHGIKFARNNATTPAVVPTPAASESVVTPQPAEKPKKQPIRIE